MNDYPEHNIELLTSTYENHDQYLDRKPNRQNWVAHVAAQEIEKGHDTLVIGPYDSGITPGSKMAEVMTERVFDHLPDGYKGLPLSPSRRTAFSEDGQFPNPVTLLLHGHNSDPVENPSVYDVVIVQKLNGFNRSQLGPRLRNHKAKDWILFQVDIKNEPNDDLGGREDFAETDLL